jgi:hypothetical protein
VALWSKCVSQFGLLPHRFLFRYSFPVRYERKLPRPGKKLLDLPAECELADLGGLDGTAPFATLRLGWNERGLGIEVAVQGKSGPPRGNLQSLDQSEGVRLFLDTRDTHNIHRASRYCLQFVLLPAGGGTDGQEPCIAQVTIPRAREEAPRADLTPVQLKATISATGYRLEAWLPAEVLYGFDPEAQPRLGFYYQIRDLELGDQVLTVSEDFPFTIYPSLWSTLELIPPS